MTQMKMSLAHMHAPRFEAVNRITTFTHQAATSVLLILFSSLRGAVMGDADAPLMQDAGPGGILSEGRGHTSTQKGCR